MERGGSARRRTRRQLAPRLLLPDVNTEQGKGGRGNRASWQPHRNRKRWGSGGLSASEPPSCGGEGVRSAVHQTLERERPAGCTQGSSPLGGTAPSRVQGSWRYPELMLQPVICGAGDRKFPSVRVSVVGQDPALQSVTFPKPLVNTEQGYEGSKTRLYEGDIIPKRQRSAMICAFNWCFWPKSSNGLVSIPFVISSSYTPEEKALIVAAMQEYETLTCIHFVDHTTETDYIDISPKDGCWSYFGKTGGPQVVSVHKRGCMRKGIIQHELNHALGMLHEQNRDDRDKYVVIAWQYISPGDFNHFKPTRADNLDLNYDYSSVMHYNRFAFSNTSGKATIIPFPDNTVPIGQRHGLSNLDVAKINKLYECGVHSTLLSNFTGTFSSTIYQSSYSNNTNSVWLIRIPANKIFLQFNSLSIQSSSDCASNHILVYDGGSRKDTVFLNKLCRPKQLPSVVSSGNMMLVELVSDGTTMLNFKASYSSGHREESDLN
ncbi:astacin-like metalloendopeptidase [Emydura macquarii macquarii]|uniref:astacin-like metalloendopeptidase n=1 Tax=Emydura macquarii macquarii TaxID=1129001 RepID=UPI00352AF798